MNDNKNVFQVTRQEFSTTKMTAGLACLQHSKTAPAETLSSPAQKETFLHLGNGAIWQLYIN
jgi:hypothetical protein